MNFLRRISWDDAPFQRDDGYRGQVLYSGENCVIIATRVPPGADGPDRHRHPSDQLYYIMEGQLEVDLGGTTEEIFERGSVLIPAGLAHQNHNRSSKVETHLEVIVPPPPLGTALVETAAADDVDGPAPTIMGPNEGERLGGDFFSARWLAKRDTGSAHVAVYEGVVGAGKSGPPLHVHTFDQFYLVLEGCLSVEIGLERFDAEPGTLVVLPAHVPHRQWNEQAEDERHLVVIVPEPTQPSTPEDPWDVRVSLAAIGTHAG